MSLQDDTLLGEYPALIWEDEWVPDLPNFKPVSKSHDNRNSCLVVSQLLRQDKFGWDEEKLNSLFDELSAKAIQRLSVRPRELLGIGPTTLQMVNIQSKQCTGTELSI